MRPGALSGGRRDATILPMDAPLKERFARRSKDGSRPADGAEPREVFRPPGWLRLVVQAAVVFWAAVLLLLVSLRGVSQQAFFGAGFFVLLFAALGAFYNNLSVEVTAESLIVRGPGSCRRVALQDIEHVDVRPGLLQISYEVTVRRGLVEFTSLFAGHRRLLGLIVERARLAPLGG
jgi:hypothetical protein